ncbi:MAG TPA: hypothetical protein VGO93_21565 [Candidatus Xenobia bacterium]
MLALYGGNLAAPLVSDDLHLLRRATVGSVAFLVSPPGQYSVYRVFYRPLTDLFYRIPASPLAWHVPQFLVGCLACLCFYRVAGRFVQHPAWATAVFAFHPSHVQPFVWSADLADTLLLALGLVAIDQYLAGQRAWTALATIGALASKETAVSLLPIFLVLRRDRRDWPLLLPFIGYASLRLYYFHLQDPSDPAVQDYQSPHRYELAGMLDRLWQTLKVVMVAPHSGTAIVVLLLAGLFIAAWSRGRRSDMTRLSLWLLVALLPTVSLFDVRYAAWPSAPFAILLVLALEQVRQPRLAWALAAFFFLRTWPEARLWRSAAEQFQRLAHAGPQHALPYAVDGSFLGLYTFHAYEFSDPIYIYWLNGTTAAFYYQAPAGVEPHWNSHAVTVPGGTVRPTWPSLLGPVPSQGL